VEPILRSQGLEGMQVISGLDHDGDPGVDPKVLNQSTPPCFGCWARRIE